MSEQTVTFTSELSALINRYSIENKSNTPDFILAQYIDRCLENWAITTHEREQWYGKGLNPSMTTAPAPPDTPQGRVVVDKVAGWFKFGWDQNFLTENPAQRNLFPSLYDEWIKKRPYKHGDGDATL